MRPTERRQAVELGAERVPRVPALSRGAPPRRPAVAARDRGRPVRLHVGRRPGHAGAARRRPPTSAASASRAAAAPASRACARSARTTEPLLADMAKFAAAGHPIDIIVGNHDVELLAPEVVAELDAPARAPPAPTIARSSRIRVVPWFVYVPGVAWIEHGHVYDEGCSFEFNLAPMRSARTAGSSTTPTTRRCATSARRSPRSIRTASRSGASGATCSTRGARASRSFGRLWLAYARFVVRRCSARARCTSRCERRDRRRREHRERLAEVADGRRHLRSTPRRAIDRLARTPLTVELAPARPHARCSIASASCIGALARDRSLLLVLAAARAGRSLGAARRGRRAARHRSAGSASTS